MLFHSGLIKTTKKYCTQTDFHPFSPLFLLSQTLRPHRVLLPNLSPPLALPPLMRSRPGPPTSQGLLAGLGSCNDASPYVCAAAAALNREDKCGILNIRIIVSLPVSAVLRGRRGRKTPPLDSSGHI